MPRPAPGDDDLDVRLLGAVGVTRAGAAVPIGGARQRTVLAVLAVNAPRIVSVDELAEAVWGDEAIERSTGTLQVYVSNLRSALGAGGRIVHAAPGYAMEIDPALVDLRRFEAHAARGQAAAESGDLHTAHTLLTQALDEWRGQLAADLPEVRTLDGDRARLDEHHLGVLEVRLDVDLRMGRHATVVAELEALVERHPLRESLWAKLMVCLYRCGRQADALRAFTSARDVLREELGLEPGPELRRVEQQVLLQRSSLAAPRGDRPALVWLDQTGQTRRVELAVSAAPIEIGRLPGLPVMLGWDAAVSRRHAALVHDQTWLVTDNDSANGTYVNGERISAPRAVSDGDVIRVGDTVVLVQAGPGRAREDFGGDTVYVERRDR